MSGNKEGAAKARQTMINKYYGGDEEAYKAAMRKNGGKGGAKSSTPLSTEEARRRGKLGAQKRWANKNVSSV